MIRVLAFLIAAAFGWVCAFWLIHRLSLLLLDAIREVMP